MTNVKLGKWHDVVTNKTSGSRTVTYYLDKPDVTFGRTVHVHVSCRTKSQSGVVTFSLAAGGKIKAGINDGIITSFVVALVSGRTDLFECEIPMAAFYGSGGTYSDVSLKITDKLEGNGAAHFSIEVRVQ